VTPGAAPGPAHHLHIERAGTGPPLLVVPGSGVDLGQRPTVLDGPLPTWFDVASYDHRGTGRSASPPGEWSMADLAEDAAEVLDRLGWERAAVLGTSFGGMVAQELALRRPGRVDRLVLVCSSSGGEGGSSYPLHELVDLPPTERARRSAAVLDVRGPSPEVQERARAAAEEPVTDGERRLLAARADHDTWARLPDLRVPTLVCGGRHDGVAPPANQRALAERIPGAQLELYDAGHSLLRQAPEALDRIRTFLAG
jgi:3-oxoadipate enol-lactonase